MGQRAGRRPPNRVGRRLPQPAAPEHDGQPPDRRAAARVEHHERQEAVRAPLPVPSQACSAALCSPPLICLCVTHPCRSYPPAGTWAQTSTRAACRPSGASSRSWSSCTPHLRYAALLPPACTAPPALPPLPPPPICCLAALTRCFFPTPCRSLGPNNLSGSLPPEWGQGFEQLTTL